LGTGGAYDNAVAKKRGISWTAAHREITVVQEIKRKRS
jgi:hypothetical protein